MYVLSNIWFQKLIRHFFYSVDKVIFNFIPLIYQLLLDIVRTSILSQSALSSISHRIYELLAVFMVFKITFSLIMYVVNPDDFSDKSKGLSKLGTNVVISLSLLILTPFIFSYAYQIQTIILEDNSLATLVFGDDTSEDGKEKFTFVSAGDQIAFNTFIPFFVPNAAINELASCAILTVNNGAMFNEDCSGVDLENDGKYTDNPESMAGIADSSKNFSTDVVANYAYGVQNKSLGLVLRQDIVEANAEVTVGNNNKSTEFIIDYKYILSTIVGVIVLLLLLTFCMDVALRSIKLSFLQIIAPIPILSYIDPKSGKDGMFKKWYQLCYKTYLSLFVRLLALYFAVFIISKIDRMNDIIDGSYQTNMIVKIFVVIGALMFAKQLPKILEGLGIKLDGDGKFVLSPLKKFEDQALGGKNITGGVRGFAVGAMGALTGAGAARMISGAFRGFKSGKGWQETGKAEREMNAKMRTAIANGSSFGGRMLSRAAGTLGLPTLAEMDKRKIDDLEAQKKKIEREKIEPLNAAKEELEKRVKPLQEKKDRLKTVSGYKGKALKRAEQKIITENAKPSFSTLQSTIRSKEARIRAIEQDQSLSADRKAELLKDATDDLELTRFNAQKAYVDWNLAAEKARREGKKEFQVTDIDGSTRTFKTDTFDLDADIIGIKEDMERDLANDTTIQGINEERKSDGYEDDELFREVDSFSDISSVSDIAADESRRLEVGTHTSKASKNGHRRSKSTETISELETQQGDIDQQIRSVKSDEIEDINKQIRDIQSRDSYSAHTADDDAVK